jgi:hypothetical protein
MEVGMDEPRLSRRFGVRERLEFIEFRLFWEGQINRSDLVRRFRLSITQASADIGHYQDLAPDNMRYDPRVKTFLAAEHFKPVFSRPSARRYLADLRSIADSAVTKERTWLGDLPPHNVVPSPRRPLEAGKLRSILQAIRSKQSLAVEYQSMSSDEPTHRWLTPHALAFDGARWHMRAWCGRRHEFRDFVLARIVDVVGRRYHPIDPECDLEWTRPVTLRIGPRPELTAGRRRIIELEYGMRDGELAITLRLRMAYYLEKNLLLDVEAETLPPERAPVTLLNRVEVDELRAATADEQEHINEALALSDPSDEG